MAGAKIVVIYPRPQDEVAFEDAYKNVHLPMCEQKFKGMNRLVATKVISSPQGETRTYRIAEVHFSTMEALNACLSTPDAKEVVDHAVSNSTGGKPVMLICEEETFLYW
jgi:uncharacterized protein (TIGR02118 family)